ncbi:hypothetical protein [Sphingomonas sp. SRS2]|uniref:hypothetical protein n=1 Tax=Sphingomonas sp. SRS2 TaxID=133190 RepID=UPI000A747C2D|nr:hypothetical protein [Sphingomonas sp. SRS2]
MSNLSTITSRIQQVTPEVAKQMLERIVGSARLDAASVQAFEHDMRDGRWALNGAPIVFSGDGQLLDGRARLNACVRSGATFESLIIEGIDVTAFETIDAVRKRTLADVLSMREEHHGRALGAALRILWTYSSGRTPGIGKPPAPTALLGVLEEHPIIRDSVKPALRAMPLLPHGCGIALHYLASAIDPIRASQFLAQIQDPISDSPDNPVNQLREILLATRGQGGARKQTYVLAVAIKAWNAFVAGKAIKLLRFAPDRESFPRIAGEQDWGPLSRATAPRLPETSRSASRSIKVKALMIDPAMADSLLADRGPNRTVSAVVIAKYARDIEAGRWRLNGQTIKISSSGRLLDGQHRLEAGKKAKKPFPAIIVEGLPDEIISSLDIGRRRATSDILRERGEVHTIILASALRWLWMIRTGVVLSANSSPSTGELLELLENTPKIRYSLKHVATIREIMGSGIAAALHCSFAEKDEERADIFFDRLIDGVNLGEGSPIRHLRERLIRTRASHRVRLLRPNGSQLA